MQLHDDFLKAVVFLGVSKENGSILDTNLGGTGFLLSAQKGTQKGFGFVFLVTAKHVAIQFQGEELTIVLNTKSAGAGGFRIKDPQWLFHDDPSVDLALLSLNAKILEFDAKWINEKDLATEDAIASGEISVGDITQTIGLFSRVPGKTRISPVVRTGNVAMFPKEKIPSSIGDIDAYLVEARSLGGISGSPTFVRPSMVLHTDKGPMFGTATPRLLGVMHGHWDISIHNEAADAQHVNMGLAIVVPARFILDIVQKFLAAV